MHQLAKFHRDILNSCGDRIIFFIFFVGLAGKRLFRLLWEVFGDLTISTTPQKALPWAKKRHTTYKPSKSVQRCDPWVRTKKQNRHGKKPDSGKLAIRPDQPRWIYVCGHIREIVIYFKFHRNPFQGFGATGCRNLSSPIDLASGLYSSLYYHQHSTNSR